MNTLDTAFERVICACSVGPAATIASGATNSGAPLTVATLLGTNPRSSVVLAIAWVPTGSNPSGAPTIVVTWQSASGNSFTLNVSTSSVSGDSFFSYLPPTACVVSVSIKNNDAGSNSISATAELQILAAREG
jgi:hypothetical protein